MGPIECSQQVLNFQNGYQYRNLCTQFSSYYLYLSEEDDLRVVVQLLVSTQRSRAERFPIEKQRQGTTLLRHNPNRF